MTVAVPRHTRLMATTTRVKRSGPSIRAALAETHSPAECEVFRAEFADALAVAGRTYDLVPLEALLDRWWGIAVMRINPLSPAEQDQLARARAGDFAGLREHDRDGNWHTL